MAFLPTGFVWNRRNVAWFIHTMTIGASGAIASQDAQNVSGLVAAKAAQAGRYTFTGPAGGMPGFRSFKGGFASLVGDATNAWGGTTVGFDSFFRAEHFDDRTNPPTVIGQFMNNSANADADLPSGTVVTVFLCVEY